MVAKPLCPLYKNIIKHLDRARYPELRYIKIYDEGIGIARSEMKTIFNRFERAAEHERDARKTRGGFGIGLNYVLQVINAHGGKVSVKSEKGKWSEFTISLPK